MASAREAWWEAAADLQSVAWRGVEAQHIIATLRLVDTEAEQQALEEMLEETKPPIPASARRQRPHSLVTTPFRYRSSHATRFRRAHAAGVWYGAEDPPTTCAEVAFWRWRFLVDTEADLGDEVLTTHTLFSARIAGRAIDLSKPPWNRARATWMSNDYDPCQRLADHCRERGVAWIRYESARRAGGICVAALTPDVVTYRAGSEQTWQCKATRARVFMIHGDEALSFEADAWQAAAASDASEASDASNASNASKGSR